MSFLIASQGRSGTKWLATVLGCAHEEPDPHGIQHPLWNEDFPIHRWRNGGPHYGECSGHLMRYLRPGYPGEEQEIDHKFCLFRDHRDIIRSWMNRDGHTEHDLPWIIKQVLENERFLQALVQRNRFIPLQLEELNIPENLRKLLDLLGMPRAVDHRDVRPVNKTIQPRWDWYPAAEEVYNHIAAKFEPRR